VDDVPVGRVRAWEHAFHEFMATRHPEIGETIRNTRSLDEETAKSLVAAMDTFKQTFAADEGRA
jgi:F-type H+-transporting ATPase subunit alpha